MSGWFELNLTLAMCSQLSTHVNTVSLAKYIVGNNKIAQTIRVNAKHPGFWLELRNGVF